MPPIPVHIDDPIKPQNTQSAGSADGSTEDSNPHAQNAYPAARPGAAAVPAPTLYSPNPPPAPTRTTQQSQNTNVPPPPQPGAVPIPPSQQRLANQEAPAGNNSLPPPPKAGEAARPPVTAAPPQMNIPPPQQNLAHTHSTTTAANLPPGPTSSTATGSQLPPTTLNLGSAAAQTQVSPAELPAGYMQNAYAQEMTSAQRASLDQQEQRENSLVGNLGLGGLGGGSGGGQGVGFGGGGGGGGGSGGGVGGGNGSMWDAVKGWANQAGKTLAETEESVWKSINGK